MQRVMITGSGMVATALAGTAAADDIVRIFPHAGLDVTDAAAVLAAVASFSPAVIFHTAALTRVNFCEEHPEIAMSVNEGGAKNIAAAAEDCGAKLVYFSTDYVFDGKSGRPYAESDPTNPVNEYGKSKLAGEKAVLALENAHVVRTSGVFGPRADGEERNFIRAIHQQLSGGSQPSVVEDLVTSLTYAPDLALAVWQLLPLGLPRVVHLAGNEARSWYGWACEVAGAMNCEKNGLQPVPSKTEDTGTPRPPFSVLKSEWAEAAAKVREFNISRRIAEYISGLA